MDAITILAVGFVLGGFVVGMSLMALVGKYKHEGMQSRIDLLFANRKLRQVDRRNAAAIRNLIATNEENEMLKKEVERLLHEKLDAWDIPGGV